MKSSDLSYIIDEDFQQEVQDFFSFATGFGVVFIDNEGNHIGEGSNFCRFCKRINETEEGAHYCALSNKQAIEIGLTTKEPCVYVCHAGLINIEIPLIYDNQCVGAITAGQVLCEDMGDYPKDENADKVNWLESEELTEYYNEISVLSRKQIEATAAALANISNYILQKVAYGQIQQDLAANREKLLLYEKQQIELEHQLKLAQLDALQKQVTPHFIFNVINSVSRLISMEEYDTARKMLDAFAEMMRYSLSDISSTVSLCQELGYIQNYLTIQKIRFGDRIDYRISCDPELENLHIPFFSLQPLVENSIKHGLLNQPYGGRLRLQCAKEGEVCYIKLEDDGEGMEEELAAEIRASYLTMEKQDSRKHIGLYNCYNRLKILFGERVEFELTSQKGKGTRILIKILLQ